MAHDRILASPGERFDVVVDFSRYRVGQEVTLKNLEGERRTKDVMRFVVARREKEESAVPERLAPDLDFPDPDEAETTRSFQFIAGGGWGGMSTINFRVFRGCLRRASLSIQAGGRSGSGFCSTRRSCSPGQRLESRGSRPCWGSCGCQRSRLVSSLPSSR